jgi:NADPH-dependent curcumin reductase CurA
MADINRQIVIDHIPEGKLGAANFRLREAPVPTPGEGELLVRTRYISLDAANRAWMLGPTYRSALSAGQMMAGGALAEGVQRPARRRSQTSRAGSRVASWRCMRTFISGFENLPAALIGLLAGENIGKRMVKVV